MDGEGPMKMRPFLTQASAKFALSERNPYPGWIASVSVSYKFHELNKVIDLSQKFNNRVKQCLNLGESLF